VDDRRRWADRRLCADRFRPVLLRVTLIGQLTAAWDAWIIDNWVRQGELNFRLTRPLSPVHEAIAENVAYKLQAAAALLIVWLVLAAVWPVVRLPFAPGRWALAGIALMLAAWIRFFNGFATGLAVFWTTRANALSELQWVISLFLSGRIAPLAMLPAGVQRVANALWFPSMLAFPVEVLTGAVNTTDALVRGFATQVLWGVVWWAAYMVVWRRGIRRYGAVGG
jgi:ABC-2 type transport system permease protein